MYRQIATLGLLMVVAVAKADDLPLPRIVPSEALPNVAVPNDQPTPETGRDLGELRQELMKLQAAREALRNERDAIMKLDGRIDTTKAEKIRQLRQRLEEAVKKLEHQEKQRIPNGTSTEAKPVSPPKSPQKTSDPIVPVKPADPVLKPMTNGTVDALSLGPALFQTGDYEGALTAYHLLNLDNLGTLDRLTVQYMTAACMRKLGKTEEAAALFREVANCKGDDLLVECSQWQLGAIRWKRDVEAKLAEMRQRRKALEATP